MQNIRSILLHLDSSARTAERLKVARLVAEKFDAQVNCLPCTMPAVMRYPFSVSGTAEAMDIASRLDEDTQVKIHSAFVTAGADSPRLHLDPPLLDAPWGFAQRALYSDLMILGQRDKDDLLAGELPVDFVSAALVESGRPALVVPYAGAFNTVGDVVLMAWKDTPESARALSAALPWMQKAKAVHLVSYGEFAGLSLRRLQGYLDTHGVTASLHDGGQGQDDAGGRLLSLAADLGADLLVMGCYGHSRAYEWVLGGATRTILDSMTLPVLMSH